MEQSQKLRSILDEHLKAIDGIEQRPTPELSATAYSSDGDVFAYMTDSQQGIARLGVKLDDHAANLAFEEFESAQIPAQLGGAWVEFILTGELDIANLQYFIRAAHDSAAS